MESWSGPDVLMLMLIETPVSYFKLRRKINDGEGQLDRKKPTERLSIDLLLLLIVHGIE